MSLADEVKAGPPKRTTGFRSRIDIWLEGLPEQDREAAIDVLKDPKWTARAAADLFARNGLDVSPVTLGAYRRNRYGAR